VTGVFTSSFLPRLLSRSPLNRVSCLLHLQGQGLLLLIALTSKVVRRLQCRLDRIATDRVEHLVGNGFVGLQAAKGDAPALAMIDVRAEAVIAGHPSTDPAME
jgi:hypothetical protein